jgi:hypothetical protein
VLQRCHHVTRKQVFESPHRIAHCGFVIKLVDFSQIGYVRLSPKPDFQSASSRYGDKWLVKRSFSRFFFRVTLPDIPRSKAKRLWLDGGRRWFFKIVHPVSTAAELQQVKTRGCRNFASRSLRRSPTTKRKSPALPGFLTNYFFDRFILPAWRSDARAARPFGSHCSCE